MTINSNMRKQDRLSWRLSQLFTKDVTRNEKSVLKSARFQIMFIKKVAGQHNSYESQHSFLLSVMHL